MGYSRGVDGGRRGQKGPSEGGVVGSGKSSFVHDVPFVLFKHGYASN